MLSDDLGDGVQQSWCIPVIPVKSRHATEWRFLDYLGQNTSNGFTGLGTDSDPILCALKVQGDVLRAILVGDRVECPELLNGLSGGPRSALQDDDVVEGGVLETVTSEFDGDHGGGCVE